MAVYGDGVARLGAVAAAATYVEDGVVSIAGAETAGRAAIDAGMRASFAEFRMLQVVAHDGLIDLAGECAAARWTTVEIGVRRGSATLDHIFGRDEDQLERTADGWRFRRRTFTLTGRTRTETMKIQVAG